MPNVLSYHSKLPISSKPCLQSVPHVQYFLGICHNKRLRNRLAIGCIIKWEPSPPCPSPALYNNTLWGADKSNLPMLKWLCARLARLLKHSAARAWVVNHPEGGGSGWAKLALAPRGGKICLWCRTQHGAYSVIAYLSLLSIIFMCCKQTKSPLYNKDRKAVFKEYSNVKFCNQKCLWCSAEIYCMGSEAFRFCRRARWNEERKRKEDMFRSCVNKTH